MSIIIQITETSMLLLQLISFEYRDGKHMLSSADTAQFEHTDGKCESGDSSNLTHEKMT